MSETSRLLLDRPRRPSPTLYLDRACQREPRRRAAIIEAYGGQDFVIVLDDLVRQGEQASSLAPR